jgi:hypothetical protein
VCELLLRGTALEVVYVDITSTTGSALPPQLSALQIRSDREERGSQGTPPAIVQWVCESLVARAQDAGLRVYIGLAVL